MSDVEYGGSVSFWDIGLAVKPIKGSAIMWYNLLPDGNVDTRVGMSHCPVFIGSKWTLPRNFWNTMNMDRYPCPAGNDQWICKHFAYGSLINLILILRLYTNWTRTEIL